MMQESTYQIIDHPAPLSVCLFKNQESSEQDIYNIITLYRGDSELRKLPLEIRLSPFSCSKGPKRDLTCFVQMGSINGISETHTISKGSTHYIFIGLEKGTYLSSIKVISNVECFPNSFRAVHFNMYNGTRLTMMKLKQCFEFIADEIEDGELVAGSRYNVIIRGKENSDSKDPRGLTKSFMIEPRNNALPYTLEPVCLKPILIKSIASEIFEQELPDEENEESPLLSLNQSIIKVKESLWAGKDSMNSSSISFRTAKSVDFIEETGDKLLTDLLT